MFSDSFRHRQSIRLRDYDYSSEGMYFVTICSRNREILFDSEEIGRIIKNTWNDLPQRFPNIYLDEFVVMPNHIHGIIIVGAPLGAPLNLCSSISINTRLMGAASSAPTLGCVMRAFKSISAILVNRHLDRTGTPLWQRNYYERIIRNEEELNRIRQYIIDNPKNWDKDPENQP